MSKKEKSFSELISETEKNKEELLKKEGKVIGETFNNQLKYIKGIKGEKGLDAFAEKSKELGREFDLRDVTPQDWYPVGLRPFGWLVMLRAFNWKEKELIDNGYQAPQTSFIMKILARYFVSLEDTLKRSPKYWKKHYTVGSLVVSKLDADKKIFILQIKDFKISPFFCIYFLGYFKKVVEFGGAKNPQVKETKCMFKGDEYHEFVITWD